MLHGIGGRTIAEAKERMTYDELLSWSEYIRLRGSLNVGNRLEYGFALIAMMINRACGGKTDMSDYMPHFEKPPASIEDIMGVLSGSKR